MPGVPSARVVKNKARRCTRWDLGTVRDGGETREMRRSQSWEGLGKNLPERGDGTGCGQSAPRALGAPPAGSYSPGRRPEAPGALTGDQTQFNNISRWHALPMPFTPDSRTRSEPHRLARAREASTGTVGAAASL